MPKWFKATCTKEIHWPEKGGETYRQGDTIKVVEEDARILTSAGVIGDIKKIMPEVETAVNEAPENAMKSYKRPGRPNRRPDF